MEAGDAPQALQAGAWPQELDTVLLQLITTFRPVGRCRDTERERESDG
jgi:hypothetical protein